MTDRVDNKWFNFNIESMLWIFYGMHEPRAMLLAVKSQLARIHRNSWWSYCYISWVLDYRVNQPIVLCLKGGHEKVTVSVLHHLFVEVWKMFLWNERETGQWGYSSVSPTVSSGFPVNSARYPLRVDLWCCGSGQLVSGEIAWEFVKFYKPWFHWPESRYLQLGLGLHPRAGESLSGCLAGCISSPASCPKNMRRKEKSCMFSSPFDQRRAGRRPWEGTPIVLDDNKRS